MVISHEDNTVDFSKNKSLDVILQIFYENTHFKDNKVGFLTLLSSVIISGTYSAKMQLLVSSVAQRCQEALGERIKWDPVFSQLPGLIFPRLCFLDAHISRSLLTHTSRLRMLRTNRIHLGWWLPVKLQTEDPTVSFGLENKEKIKCVGFSGRELLTIFLPLCCSPCPYKDILTYMKV